MCNSTEFRYVIGTKPRHYTEIFIETITEVCRKADRPKSRQDVVHPSYHYAFVNEFPAIISPAAWKQ